MKKRKKGASSNPEAGSDAVAQHRALEAAPSEAQVAHVRAPVAVQVQFPAHARPDGLSAQEQCDDGRRVRTVGGPGEGGA